jgi:hypothetical protein
MIIIVLRQKDSHLLLIRTNLGYKTVLMVAPVRAVVRLIHSFMVLRWYFSRLLFTADMFLANAGEKRYLAKFQ